MEIPKGWHLEKTVDVPLYGRVYTYKKRGGFRLSYAKVTIEFISQIPVNDFLLVKDMTHHMGVSIKRKAPSVEECQPILLEWGVHRQFKLDVRTTLTTQFVVTLIKEDNASTEKEST